MIRRLVARIVAWLLDAIERPDLHCPYDCPTHREAWLRRYPRTGW